MKPTQEQIEAALAYAKFEDTEDQFTILEKACQRTHVSVTLNSCVILAAAYRELQEENNRLKPWADLAISSNALLAIEKLKAHEPR